MVFDPPNRQIAKTTLWASPPDPDASFDQVLSRPAFCGKSYEGFFQGKTRFVQHTLPNRSLRLLCNLLELPLTVLDELFDRLLVNNWLV